MIMGQVGEYRELTLEEQRQRFGQQCRDAQALEKLADNLIQQLVVAIGRHPAAESDPEVADAIIAIEDALKERQNDK